MDFPVFEKYRPTGPNTFPAAIYRAPAIPDWSPDAENIGPAVTKLLRAEREVRVYEPTRTSFSDYAPQNFWLLTMEEDGRVRSEQYRDINGTIEPQIEPGTHHFTPLEPTISDFAVLTQAVAGAAIFFSRNIVTGIYNAAERSERFLTDAAAHNLSRLATAFQKLWHSVTTNPVVERVYDSPPVQAVVNSGPTRFLVDQTRERIDIAREDFSTASEFMARHHDDAVGLYHKATENPAMTVSIALVGAAFAMSVKGVINISNHVRDGHSR